VTVPTGQPGSEPNPSRPAPVRGKEQGFGDLVGQVWELSLTYAKEQTLEPIKALGRFVAWGLAGAVFIATGVSLLALAVLRALEVELATSGHLSVERSLIAYGGTLVFCLLVALLAVFRLLKRTS
jgi:hypothetical protein